MEFFGIQIIGILFGLLLIYITFLNFKRKEFTVREFTAWFVIGLIFIFFSVFPKTVYPLSRFINLTRPLDMFIILGFMFILGIVFYTYSIVRGIQKKLEVIVRRVAIEKLDDKRKKR